MSLKTGSFDITRKELRVIKTTSCPKDLADGLLPSVLSQKSRHRTIASDRSGADHREAQFESPPSKPKKDWSRSCSPGTRSEKDLHTPNSTSNETSTKDPFVENSCCFYQNRWKELDLPSSSGFAFDQTQGCLAPQWVIQADTGPDGANQTRVSRSRTFSKRFSQVTPALSYLRQSWSEAQRIEQGGESDQMFASGENLHFVGQGWMFGFDAYLVAQKRLERNEARAFAKEQITEEFLVQGVLK